ncbi:AraC family transcriptional regulator [Microbacterium sp. NPDC078428]|uniref:AraC family transcriptional regulator n=1 Tax=Microbacterium sp. NPDC078428 TaxID=3364190 RepID=UPI0037C8C7F3
MVEFVRHAGLPHIEARRSCQENSCYRPHAHDAFSVGIIEAGTSVFAGSLGGSVRLEPGDVIVIAAGQVHQCNPNDGSWRYQMIHMDQEWATALATTERATALFSGITVLRRSDLHHDSRAWSDLIFAGASAERIESSFRELVGELGDAAPEHTVVSDTDVQLLERLRPVLDRLRDDESNPSLDELAVLAGFTKYQLVRAVKRATGLAPLAWRQNARIAQARHMLRAGHPIADTAHELGFTDQSHFHRVFRAHVAASPGAYRA